MQMSEEYWSVETCPWSRQTEDIKSTSEVPTSPCCIDKFVPSVRLKASIFLTGNKLASCTDSQITNDKESKERLLIW